MSILQTNYPENQAAAYAGMVADGSTSNRITRTAAVAIAFGAAVFQGTTDETCGLDDGNAFLGFAIATNALGLLPGQTADEYQVADNVPILTMGTIFVEAGVAVDIGAPVYLTGAGVITDVSTDNTLLDGWVFDQTTTGAGIVRIAKR